VIGILGGKVLTSEGWLVTDVLVDGSRVAGLGEGRGAPSVIDASGCLVGPGFVDLHAHLREPGQTWKEDIASGSAAAAAGGFTALVAMPNTEPPIDGPDLASQVVARGDSVGLARVVASSTLTVARSGMKPVDFESLANVGVTMFTDDGDSVSDADVLRQAMEAVARLPYGVVAQHAEDAARTQGGHMHEGEASQRLGIGGLPASAESDVVARDLELVARTGVRYHCQHVSSRETLGLIRAAKRRGLPMTAEVTPHHLSFVDSDVSGADTNFKMYPPLRSAADRSALVEGLRDGTIDAVATDHAPHAPAEKAVPFPSAPRGVIGLETAASAVWEVLQDRDRLFEVLARAPSSIAGMNDQGVPLQAGSPANIVVFDPASTWVPREFVSRSSNSPFKGRDMRGVVRATIYRGRLVHQTGAVAA
jgi:dihydroorotase